MNLAKKALSLGTSAALVASLLATVVAPSAFAAITVGSAGNVPVGGTSANPVAFTFTEQAIASIASNTAGSFTVTILDFAGGNTLSFSGTPSVAGSTGSLGASASLFAPNVLLVKIGGSDILNIETILVTGLKIKASSGAATGAIQATFAPVSGSITSAGQFSAGGTASGQLSVNYPIGTTSIAVNVTTGPGCPFVATTTSGTGLVFATNPQSPTPNITSATALPVAPAAQVQTLVLATATTVVHNAGEVVTEATACGAVTSMASPGTVVSALTFNTPNNPIVYPGENNSPADPLVLVEPSAGFLPKASTVTYTIATPGVVFSSAPTVVSSVSDSALRTLSWSSPTANTHAAGTTVTQVQGATTNCTASGTLVNALAVGALSANVDLTTPLCPFLPTAGTVGNINFTSNPEGGPLGTVSSPPVTQGLSGPVMSADRKSATVTVTTASLNAATITLSGILYDVASTVPAGTYVSVGVTTSGALAVLPATNTNAVVFRGITASATSPTVYIGENNQPAGIVTFTESQAGFFTAGTGTGTNVFSICPAGVSYTFTVAPYAQVVGGTAAGNLILRDGSAASTTNLVQGIVNGSCYTWYVWTASTTASTIKIGGVGLTAGAPINVTTAQAPGGVDVQLWDGNANGITTQAPYGLSLFSTVQFATAVYRNQVAVTALSQPAIAAGTNHGAGGNLQIAETGLGQLKAGENICVEVLWRSGEYQDQFLNGLATADLPVATASGTGLVIGPVNASQVGCFGNETISLNPALQVVPVGYIQSFTFPVLQQTTAGDGKIVISNISYTALTGGVDGPVQLSVWGLGGTPTNVIFHSTVSNATIGAHPTLSIGAVTALGLKPTSGYSTKSLKIQVKGKYVTWKFTGGAALAGQHVTILVTTAAIPGVWGAWKPVTARIADANGIVTYWFKSTKATSISVRVEWMGNATYGDSLSPARGATWK